MTPTPDIFDEKDCEWCGLALRPNQPQQGGMHLDCYREGKADYDDEQAKDDRMMQDK
jgi:hypothetical protein